MRVNLSGADVGGFDPIPAGTYIAKVTSGEMTEAGPNAKNAGAPMIKWELTVQGGQYQGRKLFMNNLLIQEGTYGGLSRLKELLLATERYEPAQLDAEEFDFEIDDVIGADVKVSVKIRPGNQDYDPSNDIRKVRPVTEEDLADASLLP
jgi:hypothetical protein